MLAVELEWYGLRFMGAVLTKRGTAFQDFFSELMEAAHAQDFQRIRPYGNKGDLKCDGYLASKGQVFQVYAPRETKLAAMLTKIDADFAGAKTHWKDQMKIWTFVHNDDEGLPADVVQKIDGLHKKHVKKLAVETLGVDGLKTIALGLTPKKLTLMFGRPPNIRDFEALSFEPVARVLAAIRAREPMPTESIEPVSPAKLEANKLSKTVADYLKLGRHRERLVQDYFEQHPNPMFGEEVASAFREEYRRRKDDGLDPNEIFAALQAFAGGTSRGDSEHEAAVLAVLSYLFERCDIFEPPADAST